MPPRRRGRPVIGSFLVSWDYGSFYLGLFAPSIQGHFADTFLAGGRASSVMDRFNGGSSFFSRADLGKHEQSARE